MSRPGLMPPGAGDEMVTVTLPRETLLLILNDEAMRRQAAAGDRDVLVLASGVTG